MIKEIPPASPTIQKLGLGLNSSIDQDALSNDCKDVQNSVRGGDMGKVVISHLHGGCKPDKPLTIDTIQGPPPAVLIMLD